MASQQPQNTFQLRGSFLSVLLLIQGLLITMAVVFTSQIVSSHKKTDQEKTDRIASYVQNQIKQEVNIPSLAVLSIAHNEGLAKAFAEKNRPKLIEMSKPIWTEMEPRGLSQFSFFLPTENGIIAYYKAHQPEVFDSLISKSRVIVQKCNEEKKLYSGVEQGKSGYGFRAVAPIYYNEKYLGCVEFSSKFGEEFLGKLNELQNGQWALINLIRGIKKDNDSDLVSSFNGSKIAIEIATGIAAEETPPPPTLASEEIKQKLFSGQTYSVSEAKTNMVSLFIPVTNFTGEITAYIKHDFHTDYYIELRHIILTSAIVSLMGLFLSGTLIFVLYRQITVPIAELVKEADKIKNFQLNEKVFIPARLTEIHNLVSAVTNMKTGLISFQKYVPAQLVRQLIQSGQEAKINGQRRELTVLFSDIADFTTISEKLSPGELTSQLSTYLNAVTEIIMEEKGTVDKYIGDAVMAFWGAPVEFEGHATAACRAALRSQKRISELSEKWEQEGKPVFKTRIGLNTGEVVVGNMGSEQRLNYTVIGDSVNLASRVEGINKNYKTCILITESTQKICSALFETRAIDFVVVKGKTKAVKVYELISEKGQISAEDQKFNAKFTTAVELYGQNQWQEALAIFTQLIQSKPEDYPTQMFIERCRSGKPNNSKISEAA